MNEDSRTTSEQAVRIDASQVVNACNATRTAMGRIERALAALDLTKAEDEDDQSAIITAQRTRCRKALVSAWNHLEIILSDYLAQPLEDAETVRQARREGGSQPLPQ